MSRRLIIFWSVVVLAAWVIYFAWRGGEGAKSETRAREEEKRPMPVVGGPEARDAITEVAMTDADETGRRDDPLFALPADAESWRRAVENYTPADDDAYLERGHNRFAAAKHSPAVEAAPLSADDRRRLKDLLMSKELAEIDLSIASKKSGLPRRGPDFDALVVAERERLDREILKLVGPVYFAEMQTRRPMREIRLLGFMMKGEMYIRGMPLSDGQIEGINQVIAPLNDAERELPVDPATGLTAFDEKFLAGSRDVLSAEQWEIFRRLRIEENLHRSAMELKKQRRMQEKIRRER